MPNLAERAKISVSACGLALESSTLHQISTVHMPYEMCVFMSLFLAGIAQLIRLAFLIQLVNLENLV